MPRATANSSLVMTADLPCSFSSRGTVDDNSCSTSARVPHAASYFLPLLVLRRVHDLLVTGLCCRRKRLTLNHRDLGLPRIPTFWTSLNVLPRFRSRRPWFPKRVLIARHRDPSLTGGPVCSYFCSFLRIQRAGAALPKEPTHAAYVRKNPCILH